MNSTIMLILGATFALIYAAIIIVGAARTHRNRRLIQQAKLQPVATLILDQTISDAPKELFTFSLTENRFCAPDGTTINPADFTPRIAIGTNSKYPGVTSGNLILFDKKGSLKYTFKLPDIKGYN